MKVTVTATGEWPSARIDRGGRATARAITAAVASATEGAKLDLRKQLESRGGRMARLKGAIRGDVYPKPPRYSPRAAGIIYAAGDGVDRMFAAFSTGLIITPKAGKALAIPIHNYRGVDRKLLGPKSSFFQGRLVFIPASKGAAGRNFIGTYAIPGSSRPGTLRKERNTPRRKALSARLTGDKARLVPVFLLVRQAKLPKLLSPDETIARWADQIPSLVEQALRGLE